MTYVKVYKKTNLTGKYLLLAGLFSVNWSITVIKDFHKPKHWLKTTYKCYLY